MSKGSQPTVDTSTGTSDLFVPIDWSANGWVPPSDTAGSLAGLVIDLNCQPEASVESNISSESTALDPASADLAAAFDTSELPLRNAISHALVNVVLKPIITLIGDYSVLVVRMHMCCCLPLVCFMC